MTSRAKAPELKSASTIDRGAQRSCLGIGRRRTKAEGPRIEREENASDTTRADHVRKCVSTCVTLCVRKGTKPNVRSIPGSARRPLRQHCPAILRYKKLPRSKYAACDATARECAIPPRRKATRFRECSPVGLISAIHVAAGRLSLPRATNQRPSTRWAVGECKMAQHLAGPFCSCHSTAFDSADLASL
jgi:hypothetical protein